MLSPSSRWLYRVDHLSSLPIATPVVVTGLVVALVIGIVVRFSTGWLVGFEVGTSSVTLSMVFVIQHTQGREQAATQRKLDELLRALPGAETGLMMLEEASEDDLLEVEQGQRQQKEDSATDDVPSADADQRGDRGRSKGTEQEPRGA